MYVSIMNHDKPLARELAYFLSGIRMVVSGLYPNFLAN